jgi:hypothetical protein
MNIRRLLMLVVCALAAGLVIRQGANKFSLFGSISGHTTPLKEPIPAYTRSLRPNYPYSIIPGGAYSTAELRYADREDPVVKEHYADFNMKRAQMAQLTADRYQYVSYRLKQRVYWTKKKLKIPKGEVLLTDGVSWARARCGNRLSETPHQEVSAEEPAAKALLMPPMQLGTPMDLAETPPLGELASIAPVNIERFPPVLPPASDVPPLELGPLVPGSPITPVLPIGPTGFSPVGSAKPPTTPIVSTAPIVPPGNTTIIPPPNTPTPQISAIPEPRAVYLFLVTFVLSLYGLTRMLPLQETTEGPGEEGPKK